MTANIQIFIIKKQTVTKHPKTSVILIDISELSVALKGVFVNYAIARDVLKLSYMLHYYVFKHSSAQTRLFILSFLQMGGKAKKKGDIFGFFVLI